MNLKQPFLSQQATSNYLNSDSPLELNIKLKPNYPLSLWRHFLFFLGSKVTLGMQKRLGGGHPQHLKIMCAQLFALFKYRREH